MFSWNAFIARRTVSRYRISILTNSHFSSERQESDVQNAERIIQAGLAKTGWQEEDLARWRKSDLLKLHWAAQFRRETSMTLKWITARLKMGTWKHLNRRLHEDAKPSER